MAMNTGGRLVAGSHNRNEFILINADEIGRVSVCINPQYRFSFHLCCLFFRLKCLSLWNLFMGSNEFVN